MLVPREYKITNTVKKGDGTYTVIEVWIGDILHKKIETKGDIVEAVIDDTVADDPNEQLSKKEERQQEMKMALSTKVVKVKGNYPPFSEIDVITELAKRRRIILK
jgi:hypothetical protein